MTELPFFPQHMLAPRPRFIAGAAAWIAVLSFFGGMLLITLMDLLVPSHENPHEARSLEGSPSPFPSTSPPETRRRPFGFPSSRGFGAGGGSHRVSVDPAVSSATIFEILFASVAGIMVFISMDRSSPPLRNTGRAVPRFTGSSGHGHDGPEPAALHVMGVRARLRPVRACESFCLRPGFLSRS